METVSALLALVTVDTSHKGQRRGALIYSLIYAWTNVWANNRNAGALRRHSAHYDVIVMCNRLAWFWMDWVECTQPIVTNLPPQLYEQRVRVWYMPKNRCEPCEPGWQSKRTHFCYFHLFINSDNQSKLNLIYAQISDSSFFQVYETVMESKNISLAQCKNTVTLLLTHWSYCNLALSHRYRPLGFSDYIFSGLFNASENSHSICKGQ